MRKWILPAFASLVLLAGCNTGNQNGNGNGNATANGNGNGANGVAQEAPIPDSIHGTVMLRDPIPVHPNSKLDVKLHDVALPQITIAGKTFTVGDTPPPFEFDLPLDPERIDRARTYVLNVILADGDRHFEQPLVTPVLTQGAGANPKIVLSAEPTPAEAMKDKFQKLQSHIGGMKKVAGTYTTDDASVGWDAFADQATVRFARVNTDYDSGGSSSVKYAYLAGEPMALVKQEGGVTSRAGWDESGQVVLNEKSGGEPLSDEELKALHDSAEGAYKRAQDKVDAKISKRRR